MRSVIHHDLLIYQFLSCLSTGRSSALERLRSNASSVFTPPEGTSNPGELQLDQALFATGVNRSQNKRVCQLLGIVDGGKTFSALPPILFSRENSNIMSRLFFHPSLFRVTCSLLSINWFFLINYITAGASYCLRTYFPDPEESQETYDACQQYLL